MSDNSSSENTQQYQGYILDADNVAEMARQMLHDHLLTQAMGGPLAEPIVLSEGTHVMDIACGLGGRLLDLLNQYPYLHGQGIDVNSQMIEYATSLAQMQGIAQLQF